MSSKSKEIFSCSVLTYMVTAKNQPDLRELFTRSDLLGTGSGVVQKAHVMLDFKKM
jgi:hypothetical protein